jgi:hypothetical protein
MTEAAGLTLGIAESSPLRAAKEIPVLSPPEVFAVYVPSHVDREHDLLVGEHWLFFKLSESEWFTERRQAVIPAAGGAATESQLAPLKSLTGFEKAVVPYRESKP